eukprot:4186402-Pleurochrysis_carterae.AAC.1
MNNFAVGDQGDDDADDANGGDDDVAPTSAALSSGGRHPLKYELECISLCQQIDAQRTKMDALQVEVAASDRKAVRALRSSQDAAIVQAQGKKAAAVAAFATAATMHEEAIKQQRAAASATKKALLKQMQGETPISAARNLLRRGHLTL